MSNSVGLKKDLMRGRKGGKQGKFTLEIQYV